MQGYIDARTGETYDTGSDGANDEMSDIELSKKAIEETGGVLSMQRS
jgi:hypothetical protein